MRIASNTLVTVSCSFMLVAAALAGCSSSNESATSSPEVIAGQKGGVGAGCGARGLGACNAGLDCVFPVTAACGETDGAGTCEARPDVCPQSYEPVCGCDGKTYSNECAANAAGMSARSAGACATTVDAGGGGLGAGCGTRGLGACSAGLYCQHSEGAACGELDQSGTCAKAPTVCPKDLLRVCGCDGTTYNNSCEAAAAGMSIRSSGPCAK